MSHTTNKPALTQEINEVIDCFLAIDKPVGPGVAIEEDASDFDEFIEKDVDCNFTDIEDYKVLWIFNNDQPYYVGDATLGFLKKSTQEIFMTTDYAPIRFEEHNIIMANDNAALATEIRELS